MSNVMLPQSGRERQRFWENYRKLLTPALYAGQTPRTSHSRQTLPETWKEIQQTLLERHKQSQQTWNMWNKNRYWSKSSV